MDALCSHAVDKTGMWFLSIILMLVLISALVIAHELGHFWVARACGVTVERFGFGLPFGPTLWRKKINGVEYCIHLLLFGGYVAFPDDEPDSTVPPDSPTRFENRPIWQRAAIALAGITVNFILGWLLMVAVILGWGFPSADVTVEDITAGSPAAAAGLRPHEAIVALNGKPVAGYSALQRMTDVSTRIQRQAGAPLQITLKALPVEGEAKPAATRRTLQVTPDAKTGRIGIALGAAPNTITVRNPLKASAMSVAFLWNFVELNFQALGRMVTGQVGLGELSGPIRIVDFGAKLINERGIQEGLTLAAIISTILAVMNLLPIPALDGGHLLFLAIEAIKGSPLNREVQQRIVQAGFLTLLLLMGFILWNDIRTTFFGPPAAVEEGASPDKATPSGSSGDAHSATSGETGASSR